MMTAIAISLDHISTSIVVESIAISPDCVSMDVDGGFNGGFNSGFDGQIHLAVLGYQPQENV